MDENERELNLSTEYSATPTKEDFGIDEKSLLLRDLMIRRNTDDSDEWVVDLNVRLTDEMSDNYDENESEDWIINI